MNAAALTVSELTDRIKEVLETGFTDVWVTGEIRDFTRANSGHVYLTLKDEGASLGAVIWRSTADRLRHELSAGMEVLAHGRLSLYAPRGQYQLTIRTIEPRGAGALAIAFEKLRARLMAEGLFDAERKRPIPFLPEAIGVVTSPTGAAIRDIMKVVRRRFRRTTLVLAPARVQGEGAALEIARGIERLNARGGLSVLIVGRGGGSQEDLWAFNEEPVARAIAGSGIPVISAVGHEVDVSIADYVADVRAATPSAAAELAVPDERELRGLLGGARERLTGAARTSLRRHRERLDALAGAYGLRSFTDRLREKSQGLDDTARRLNAGAGESLSRAREKLARLAGRAQGLSPLEVLARGYSVTTVVGRSAAIRSAGELEPGDRIRTRLGSGTLISKVEEVTGGD